jgi:hypothetical protein
MEAGLGKYEGKLLRRHVPGLPATALAAMMTRADFNRWQYFTEKKVLRGTEAELSKMEMRRILRDTFAELAGTDPGIRALLGHWDMTGDRPKRKSQASQQQHSQKWHEAVAWQQWHSETGYAAGHWRC